MVKQVANSSRVFGNGVDNEALKSYCCTHILESVVGSSKDAGKEKKVGEHDFVMLPQSLMGCRQSTEGSPRRVVCKQVEALSTSHIGWRRVQSSAHCRRKELL